MRTLRPGAVGQESFCGIGKIVRQRQPQARRHTRGNAADCAVIGHIHRQNIIRENTHARHCQTTRKQALAGPVAVRKNHKAASEISRCTMQTQLVRMVFQVSPDQLDNQRADSVDQIIAPHRLAQPA